MKTSFFTAAIFTSVVLTACATTPERAKLPMSTLTVKTEPVEGSAIAFHADNLTCNNSSFSVSPKLADGKYGDSERWDFSSSMFKGKTTKINSTSFKASKDHLYVKSMAPGKYVITRISCTMGNRYFHTRPERIDIYGEFDVDPGVTNYIGQVSVGSSFGGMATFKFTDKTELAKVDFAENYAESVAPMKVKLGKTTAPDLSEIMKKFQEILEKAKAKAAADKAAAEAAKTSP